MSVMPLPHHHSFWLHNTGQGVRLQSGGPSIGELGRFHFQHNEIREFGRQEKEREKFKMAFELIKVSELPVTEVGRKATVPKIAVLENGRFAFNSFINNEWGSEISKLLIWGDKEGKKLQFQGFKESAAIKNVNPKDFEKLVRSKPDPKSKTGATDISCRGQAILTALGYDYGKAGNQVYTVTKDDKGRYLLTLPAETPARRAVKPRKKRAVNGAVNGSREHVTVGKSDVGTLHMPEAPAEEDLLEVN